MNRIELVPVLCQKLQRIAAVELFADVARLRTIINSGNVKSG